jgi:hypothetical protein
MYQRKTRMWEVRKSIMVYAVATWRQQHEKKNLKFDQALPVACSHIRLVQVTEYICSTSKNKKSLLFPL